jgi:Ras-related protein Rab-11A
MEISNEFEKYKIILVGESGSGKSSIMKRFCRNQFCLEPETTLGIEFDS